MFTVDGDLVTLFSGFVGNAMDAFLPLLAAVIGIFLAFAIANRATFLVGRMVKK